MKTKTFDCIELKRKASERIHRELQGLSREEKIAYWKRRNEELLEHQRQERMKSGK